MGCKSEVRVPVCLGSRDSAVVVASGQLLVATSERQWVSSAASSDNSTIPIRYSPTLTSVYDYWKNHSSNYKTFVGKVMSLLFSTLSRLNHKNGWALKNWYFWIVVLEKTLESPLDSKEIKPVSPKGNPPWIFIGRTDAEAEALILWPPDVKNQIIGKSPDAGKDRGQEEKRVT